MKPGASISRLSCTTCRASSPRVLAKMRPARPGTIGVPTIDAIEVRASIAPLGVDQGLRRAFAFAHDEAVDRHALAIDAGEGLDLVGELEPLEGGGVRRVGSDHRVRELHGHVVGRLVDLEAVDEDAAAEEPLVDGGAGAIARGARAFDRGGARHARGHQLEQRQQMRATQRPAELRAQLLREGVVEPFARQLEQTRRRIAAALALRRDRGLDRDIGLVDADRVDRQPLGVELELDVHRVDDARGLDVVARRHEAVLAQVDHVAAREPSPRGHGTDGDRERARVQGQTLHERTGQGAAPLSRADRSCAAADREGCSARPSW